MSGERVLDALSGKRVAGWACVIRSRDLDSPGAPAIRVGRALGGMAVFACGWACPGVADYCATPRVRVSARAVDAALSGYQVAVEAVGDTQRVSLDEMVVATELRHLADDLHEGIRALRHRPGYFPTEHAVGIRDALAVGVATGRDRVAQLDLWLDPAGGEPR